VCVGGVDGDRVLVGILSNAGPPHSPNFLKHKALGESEAVDAPDGRESRIW